MVTNKKKPEHSRKVSHAEAKRGAAAMSQAMMARPTRKAKGQINRKEKKI